MENNFEIGQIELIVEALPDAALVIGEDGTVLAANRQADNFYESAMTGQHILTVLRAPAVWQAVNEAILQSKIARISHVVRTPVQRNFDVNISPIGSLENSGRIALIILRDLTYEQQIERMRSDFVANASHELRTPLASLSGFIETMQGAAKNDTKAKDKFLDVMKAQADRMASLIDDLLSLSRIEISEHVSPTETVNLATIVKQAVSFLSSSSEKVSCELRVEVVEPLYVSGDANQLSQVVHNLIENAIKYASVGKAIEIQGSEIDGMAQVMVKDFGPGIAPHHVPRLTERFYRVSTQDSRSRGGTGLGLAICKHIINRHRGKLSIASELGKGSCFSIHLPIKNNI